MTLLVAGNASHLDLILQAQRQPGPSDVAALLQGPGARGVWLPGGAARTIALALRARGHQVRLWYPHSIRAEDNRELELLRLAGVDITRSPAAGENVGRCVMVYAGGRRQAWSTPPAQINPEGMDDLFEGITHLVISPVWGSWAEILVAEAERRRIPSSLIGEAVGSARLRHWHTAIVDEEQNNAGGSLSAVTLVVTDGAKGARVIERRTTYAIAPVAANVLDTTGAGDAFGGTFLGCRLHGDSIEASGAAAAEIAARTCEGWGSWSSLGAHQAAAPATTRAARIRGALAATACGDAFGMPNSFLQAPAWRTTMDPGPANSPYHAGYPAGRITDDTEQAIALTDALEEGFTPDTVARHLNKWFQGVGGENSLAVGPSTKRALMAYQAGVPVSEIGLFGVTNGAAMRISPIGVYGALAGLALEQLADLVAIACVPTHATSPANSGATALASAIAAGIGGGSWEEVMAAALAGARAGERRGKWIYAADVAARIELARRLAAGARSKREVATLMSEIVGAGEATTESVPAAIGIADYAKGDPQLAIEIAGNLRGDTDTVAAMAGAVCGAFAGDEALPAGWRELVSQVNNLDVAQWAARLERAAARGALASLNKD